MVKHVLVGYQGVSTSSSPSSLIPKDKFRLTVQICKSSLFSAASSVDCEECSMFKLIKTGMRNRLNTSLMNTTIKVCFMGGECKS